MDLSANASGIMNTMEQKDKKDILKFIVFFIGFLTFPLVVCSFVVAGTANAGFNCVLTGLLNISFVVGSYFVLKKSKAPIAVSISRYSSYRVSFNQVYSLL